MQIRDSFLPVSAGDVKRLGWSEVDFVFVTADAYVDHPSFGAAILSRLLESEGYRVAIISASFITLDSLLERTDLP